MLRAFARPIAASIARLPSLVHPAHCFPLAVVLAVSGGVGGCSGGGCDAAAAGGGAGHPGAGAEDGGSSSTGGAGGAQSGTQDGSSGPAGTASHGGDGGEGESSGLDGANIPGSTYAGPRAAHVDNPYAAATFYVNASWAANVTMTAAQTSDSAVAAALRTVAGYSTAVWLDSVARIAPTDGTTSLAGHLDAAVAQQKGSTPVVITLVIYDLPGRDCAALASNGELPATSAGLDSYEHSYIDAITSVVGQALYGALRIVTVIEPDSLPNLVTNTSVAACSTAAPFYEQGVEYALSKLHTFSNVYTYLDTAHSGWLGWPSNSGPMATEFAKVAHATPEGLASVDGFVTDTANYTPLVEPYLTATEQVSGQPVEAATFYQYNPDLDEADFAADMYAKLTSAGFPSSIGMLIDTSRDGWGGSMRPAQASTSTDLNTFVDASRIDRRAHRGLWCNVSGAGLGEPPHAAPSGHPAAHLDAYVWVKPPGESDGTSAATTNTQGKKSDPNCDPSYTTSYGVPTGALPNAPLAGQWFPAQIVQLVQNAYPAVP